MNGSRTNKNVPKDLFRDYDIVYLVEEMDSFKQDSSWIDVFGERMLMQTPEAMDMFENELGNRFSYLMWFKDGTYIDLTLIPYEDRDIYAHEDGLTVILLDKDGVMPALPSPSDREYWVQKPSEVFFNDCRNEFWCVSTYVAKGLWRQEILYAMDHLNLVRSMFLKMVEWKVGIDTDFSLSIGKNGKFLKRYVSHERWCSIKRTYPVCEYEEVWDSLFIMIEEFEKVTLEVAEQLKFNYSLQESAQMISYLEHVRQLPTDAESIY